MEDSERLVQVAADAVLAGPCTLLPLPALPQAHGITTNQGDFNLAGRDVNIQNYYHAYPDNVDISAVLGAIRNLRVIHLDILSKATPGTGAWLFRTPKFLIWLNPNSDLKILWGTGIPGAGKTVLTSIVIQVLEAVAAIVEENGLICVCYVYIRYSDRADLSVRNIMEILVKQTVERHPDCAVIAEKAYARHIREKTQPTEAELLQLLHQFTEVNAATYYLLDALDEAPDRIQVDLVERLASLDVRLFITSRPLDAVLARAPNVHRFLIVAQDRDLDLHIKREIARSRDLANFLEKADPSLRAEIVSLVKSKCGGMFLHAALQLDALCECVTAREVRQTLDAFPSKIEDVYRQTWQRLMGQKLSHVLLAKTALFWVLNSSRPMTIEELQRAVATSPETYQFERDRLAPGMTLIALCRGLLTLEEESRLVRLVHYTVKDTLQALLHDFTPHPHSYLTMVCMTHLMQCGFQNTRISSEEEFIAARQADPLLAYASDAWAVHARASLDVEGMKERIASFICETRAFPAFTGPDLLDDFDILSPLHILTMYHLPLSFISQDDIGEPNVATQIHQESPLTLASRQGHEEAVAFLVARHEVLVNWVNKNVWSAAMAASRYGHEGIVRLLLARPDVDVNLFDGEGSSALMKASIEGHKGIVALFLEHPEIQINLVNNKAHSALMLAASHGHDGIAQALLVRSEIQVNLVDNEASSALMLAAGNGHKTVVKLLIRHPTIKVNLVQKGGSSALILAAGHGHMEVVASLLEHPETLVNLVDNRGWSALMLASSNGHNGIVQALLARSEIHVNLVDRGGWSALMLATRLGYLETVTSLLKHSKVLVNLVNSRGWSALMRASNNGYDGISQALLARSDIQVNLVGKDGWSGLMLAAGHGRLGAVKSLLVHPELLVNLVSSTGWSALILAASNGHEAVVKLLVGHPAIQVNSVSNRGWSALMRASKNGQDGTVNALLVRPEIKVNSVDNEGWSALMLAAGHGRSGIVASLLRHTEVLVNLVNNRGWSALMLASSNGHDGTIKALLVCSEVQVNLVDREGWSALMLAAGHGHLAAVTTLLAHPELLVNPVNKTGRSALILASNNGHDGVARALLLRSEIQVNLVDRAGWSALMLAAGHGHLGVAASLLERHEMQVNLVNSEGRSALMLAARHGYEGVVKLLLKRTEIRVDLVDHKGLSALALAASWGHESIIRLLLHVPNIDTTTNRQDGQTAMSLALDHGHLGVYQLLQEFQPRCEVELEITALGPANLVDLDALEDDYEDQEKGEDSPSDEEVQGQSESSDSDCYEDAQEWLEGVDV